MQSRQIRTYPYPQCYLCGSEGEWLYQNLTDQLFGVPGHWNLKICTSATCGLVWLDPMPVPEDLDKAYQRYYTHADASSPRMNSLLYLGRALFQNLRVLLAAIPGTNRQRLLYSNRFLQGYSPGRLLDVGCGNGQFLLQMQACGWEVEGVDFDPKAVEQARDKHGLTMYAGELREVAYAQDAFDAITLNHVIEHLPEPIEVLTECRRILRPGGHLVVITPNVNSWGRRRFTSHWRGLEPPRHLFLFSPHTLAAVATKVGFDDFQVFSRAGGATPYMLKTSLETERLNQHPSTAGLLNKGLILSLYEKLLMFKYPDWGEEAVLLAIK